MKIFEALDVREREGKNPIFTAIATVYFNDNGKASMYLPMTGRFYPLKEKDQKPRDQQPEATTDGAPF
jgi:hypothetical protein